MALSVVFKVFLEPFGLKLQVRSARGECHTVQRGNVVFSEPFLTLQVQRKETCPNNVVAIPWLPHLQISGAATVAGTTCRLHNGP